MTGTIPMVSVTVAPGAVLTVDPHPSGILELGPLRLGAGQTCHVSEEQAQRLYDAGTILHPTTGRVRPPARVAPPQLPQVTTFETQEAALERTARERAATEARMLRGEVPAEPRMVVQEGGWLQPPDVEW